MTTNKIISLGNINFSGFSSSEFWVGYFEAKNISDLSLVKDASRLVYNFFQENWVDFFLLGALTHTSETDDSIMKRLGFMFSKDELEHYLKIYHQAIDTGFISPYSQIFEQYFDNDLNEYNPLFAEMVTLNFEHNTFLSYCELLMVFCFEPIIGQKCFLINPKLKIALYPHDDTGFGVISLTKDKSLGIEFLEYCKKNENFNVYIDV